MTDSAPRPPRRGTVPSCPRPGHLASSAPSTRPGHTRPPFFSPARRTEPQPVGGLAGRETENDTCLWVTAVEFRKARGPSGTYGRELSPRGGAARAFACGPWAQTGARAPPASPAPPPCTLPGGPRASGAPRSRQPLPHAFKDRDGALGAALPWLCGCFSSPHAQPPPAAFRTERKRLYPPLTTRTPGAFFTCVSLCRRSIGRNARPPSRLRALIAQTVPAQRSLSAQAPTLGNVTARGWAARQAIQGVSGPPTGPGVTTGGNASLSGAVCSHR